MLKKETPYFDVREKRAFSLASDMTGHNHNSKQITNKIQNYQTVNNKFPTIISPTSLNSQQKCFIFFPPIKNNASYLKSFRKNSDNSKIPFFDQRKSIDLTTSFKKMKTEESNNVNINNSKKFHFLDEIDNSKIVKLSQTISPKNKYLPYISMCNKYILDLNAKQNSLHISNFPRSKIPSVYQNENVFLTNVDTNNKNKDFHEKFDLKNLVTNDEMNESVVQNHSLVNRRLKLHKFTLKKKLIDKNQREGKNPIGLVDIGRIKDENYKHQQKVQFQKINSLMDFAEKMTNIINVQKNKINQLLQNVSDKFESVVHNS